MSRALGPRPSAAPGSTAGGWAVLIASWSMLALLGFLWVAAATAAAITGGRTEPLGLSFIRDVVHGRWHQAWPHTPTIAVIITAVVLGAVITALATAAVQLFARFRSAPGDPVAALSRDPRTRTLTRRSVVRGAAGLRRSLADMDPREIEPAQAGLDLGRLLLADGRLGSAVYASWEDTVVAFMAPRSGKTTAQAIPFVLSAPGPVIATSNKSDLWAATSALREQATGEQVWLFDPQQITYQPQTWWWNLLDGLHTVEDAHRLAGHFVLTVADENRRDLWGPAAQDLLSALFLAAGSAGLTLHDVAVWLNEPAVPTPAELLMDAGFAAMSASLRGAQNGAVETRDGIYQTARTAAKAMTDPQIMGWVTPPRRGILPVFDPHAFATSSGTLYLLSKSRSAAAPLIAALSDTVMRAAERHAERLGGRLDPPLVVPLDEAANICRIADLPDLYSHLGSRGIVPITILQSYEKGVTVWGEQGMAALWGAATKKIIGAGVDSPRLARDLATLVGQHDVPVRTLSYGDGRASESVSLRRQDILEPAAIRALPPGTALLLATGIRPALIHLTPWYAGPRAADITAAQQAAEEQIREQAIAAGPWYRDQPTEPPF
ncbi:MAG TPA: TraM recognition domain-containing protein [Streptosporangiaceae bacterium]|nr:TraM recognition domain-containing protein [Streptosporangiaceae bacterium]